MDSKKDKHRSHRASETIKVVGLKNKEMTGCRHWSRNEKRSFTKPHFEKTGRKTKQGRQTERMIILQLG